MQVETAKGADGASVARVHVTLVQPMRPRVRSSRNMIYVEADRLDRPANTTNAIINGSNPSSAIRDVRVARRGEATAVTLHSTGRLVVSGVEASKDGPPKLYIDLPNATSALAGTTPIGTGPVDSVRVGLNINNPLVTRVTMDLTRTAPYRLESSANGNDLTVVFDPPGGHSRFDPGFRPRRPAIATGGRRPAGPGASAGRSAGRSDHTFARAGCPGGTGCCRSGAAASRSGATLHGFPGQP